SIYRLSVSPRLPNASLPFVLALGTLVSMTSVYCKAIFVTLNKYQSRLNICTKAQEMIVADKKLYIKNLLSFDKSN
ncbi:MAG: hypothetical protein AB1607_14415, partial [Chloroflexota bacterium]